MKMCSSAVVRWVLVAITFCCVAGQFVGQTLNEPRAQTAQHAPGRQGFFDYALGKVNPHDTDYGARIVSVRNAVVGYTIDDLYFWSNVVTLLLLSGLVAIVLFQWRSMDKRELIAATLIAQLWNGRVSDKIEIERRTEQFNRLVETYNAEAERALTAQSRPATGEEQADSELKRTVEGLDKRRTKKIAPAQETTANLFSNILSDVQSTETTGASLQQRNIMLERQVEAMQDTEANLRRRLNDTMAQLEQERNRNQTLKGA
jgi:hypothetical protein